MPAIDNGRHIVSVLGMHRCGTSLTRRLINLLGVGLGTEDDRLEPRFANSQYERGERPIVEVNDAIFDALGGSWWRPPKMPTGWQYRPEVEALVPRAHETLAARFAEPEGSWSWEDPRTSLTLPFWRQVVPHARYVVCLRNPADVANSLLRREPSTHTWESAITLWLRYAAEALGNTRGEERLLVFYEDYPGDTEGQLSRLAQFVGRDLGEVSKDIRDEAEHLIQTDLRQHRTSATETLAPETVPPEAGAFFLAVRAAHVASMTCSGRHGRLVDQPEPGLLEAAADLGPRLWHGQLERQTVAAVEEDPLRAVAAAERERDEGIAASRRDAAIAIAAVERERDEARRTEREHRIALDRALEELEGMRGEADGTRAEGDEYLEGELERKERALVRAQADLARTQSDLAGIRSSQSWKVTAPLRSGKRLFLSRR